MKKWMIGVACLLAFAFSPGAFVAPPAQAVTATTKYTLTTSSWTDLGVGPVLVSATGRVVFAVADTTPSLVTEGFSVLPGASFTFNTASHVWAMSLDGISPYIYVAPILASSGGGGGSLVGGTTPITGTCPSGQFLYNNAGVLGCSASSASIALPQVVTGGVSGGVAYFSNTTTMSSSALLAANALVVGGGAGVAPSTVTTGTGVVTAAGVNTNTNGGLATATTSSVVVGAINTGGGSGTAPVGLADVATGSYLKSGGVTTIPAWQPFGTGVQAAVALNANAAGGVALVSTVPTAGNYVKWAAGGLVDGGAGSGGGITAGTTTTSGFTAGQAIYSDGSLAQAATSYYSANLSSQRNGVTAQAERVYNTYTDASNGEWGTFDWTSQANTLTIGTQANGTGTVRNISFVVGGTTALVYGQTASYWTTSGGLLVGGASATAEVLAGSVGTTQNFTSQGTQPTVAGGTCSMGTVTKVGSGAAGTFSPANACATGTTIVFTGLPSNRVANGYSCFAMDRTTPAALIQESATTTSGVTFKVAGVTTVAADVIQWSCIGY